MCKKCITHISLPSINLSDIYVSSLSTQFNGKDQNENEDKICNLKGQEKWNKISVLPDLTKMQCMEDKQLFSILSDKAKEQNEASDARDGIWKVIGRRGNKRLVLTK